MYEFYISKEYDAHVLICTQNDNKKDNTVTLISQNTNN